MSDCCKGKDDRVSDGQPGGAFALVDHDGRNVTDQSYLGKIMLLFFGFTHCRSVCPVALGHLSAVIERLGEAASQLQPLYVTVDPDRDTPEVMKAFLKTNYPRFKGLTGPRENLEHVKTRYRVFAKRVDAPDDPSGYQMPHTAFAYLIGRDGRYVTHFTNTADEDRIVDHIAKYLAGQY
jgi:protein SCO1